MIDSHLLGGFVDGQLLDFATTFCGLSSMNCIWIPMVLGTLLSSEKAVFASNSSIPDCSFIIRAC